MENIDPSRMNQSNVYDKKVRLSELLNRIKKIEESERTGLRTFQEIREVIQDLHELEQHYPILQRLINTDETLIDSKVLSTASELVLKCADAVNMSSVVYDPIEFASKIKNALRDDPTKYTHNDLYQLSDTAIKIVHTIPKFSPLYGTYNISAPPQRKEKKTREKNVKQKEVVKKHLIKVTNADKEEQTIDDTINFLTHVLQREYEQNGNNPINYYEYVIDTDDFGQTVENIFYTLFLIRDGKAKLDIDINQTATIQPMTKHDLKRFKKENGVNHQLITSITMDEWKNFNTEKGLLQKYKTKK